MATAQNIADAKHSLLEEFALFDDWMGRYEYLIDLGKQLPPFPEDWKSEENRIHGCQSQVWLHAEPRGDRLHFEGTSDAAIVSGLIAVLLRVYDDRRPQDILATKPDFLADIGFTEHLSPTRSNGLHAMLQAIYAHARRHLGDAS